MKSGSIVVVDDDTDFGASLAAVLETRGHRVRTASSRAECMALLSSAARVDLVLLDVRLGRESGLDVLAELRAEYPDLPCVMLTAFSTMETALTALRQGAFDHVSKPPETAHLFAVVDRALRMSEVTREAREAQELLTRERAALERLSASQAEALRALSASEGRLAGILDIAADGILAIDSRQRIVHFNRAAEEIFGYSTEEIIGRPLSVLVPDDLVDAHHGHAERVRRTAGTVRGPMSSRRELKGQRQDGSTFPAEVSISKVGEGEAAIMTAIVRDVSDRRRAEEELRHAQRMEVVGRVAGSVAHDFNNILTVIMACASALEEAIITGPLGEEVSALMDASERAVRITRQLLAVSRRQVLEPGRVDLSEVVQRMTPMLERMVGPLGLHYVPSSTPLPVFVDVGQLEQVLLNLVINARDSMVAGGTVTVRIGRGRLAERGEFVEEDEAPTAAIRVSDRGAGMEPDVVERIFEPFFSTKPSSEGVGLGLSTVYGIVRQFGGDIRVESSPGEGSTFTVILPLDLQARAAPKPTPSGHAIRGGGTILVVEDEPLVRQAMVKVLERRDYHVIEAGNGQEALDVIERVGAEIDLVLSDVVMPVMTGPALAVRLRDVLPGVPVLFVTGYSGDLSERYQLDLSQVVLKPFRPDTLARRIAEAIARKTPDAEGPNAVG